MGATDISCDVLIIGAGIVGCSVAHALAVRGMSVVVVDAGAIGSGTSATSFSWINATSKVNDEVYFRLNAHGLSLYEDLAEKWGSAAIGLHQTGMLEWSAAEDASRMQELQETAERLNNWDYPAVWVDRKDLRQMEPNISFEDGAAGYFAKKDCWLDVALFLQFLIEQLERAGAHVMEYCPALELIATEDGRVLGVETERGKVSCGSAVLATGADSAQVLSHLTGHEGFASRFPLRQAPGVLVLTPPTESALVHHVVYSSHSSGLHVRDAGRGRLLIGADDTDGLVSEDSSKQGARSAASLLLDRTHQLIPSFEGAELLDQCQIDVGIRGAPIDGRSIAGPALSAEGLYLAITHSGVTLAPVLGELIANCIDTGVVPEKLVPFSLDRFDTYG